APPLRESMQAVDSRPPGSGLDDARAAHTTSALPAAWIVTPLCPATAACVYSLINVPRLTSIVKHSKGHRVAWGAISTYTAGGRHQDANPCPFGQNIRTCFPTGSYTSTIAHASACLPLHSYPYSAFLWMAQAEEGADGLETPAGVYHGDRRSGTAA